ncbi:MAG: hypothetical protein LBR25_07875 [Erysipelotrichaceae bacterium]|jgi:phage shock protein A|nr:hypothetical protein [Erysipelotrichaceae bacterium]
MPNLIEKLWDSALGKLHALVDKVYNTPETYAQAIRKLEGVLADLYAARDEEVGRKNGITKEVSTLKAAIAKNSANRDLLLSDDDESNDSVALSFQLKIDADETRLAEMVEMEAEAIKNVTELSTALDKGEQKRAEMVHNLKKLQMTAKTAEAKSKAAGAIEDALKVFDSNSSIDSISGKIEEKARTADAKFERVVGSMHDANSPEEIAALAEAKAKLEARKAELNKTE